MSIRFKEKGQIFDFAITAVAAVLSVGIMLYGVGHFGLREAWPELVLNLFYMACLVMMWMYFFNFRITTEQFNYWCSVCVGITVPQALICSGIRRLRRCHPQSRCSGRRL
jgi:hypothetical protein